MEWKNAETNPPDHMDSVLVCDGDGDYTVAWYRKDRGIWSVSDDMLESNTGDRWCHISLTDAVKFWAEIEPIK